MIGPECGRDVRFTLHSWVYSVIVNCKCTDSKLKPAAPLVIVARWDEPGANFSSCALVTAAGASHPALLLLWCPLNSSLCVSSLVSHHRCSSLLFFFHYSSGISSFFISYFLPLCCPCPFTTPTSHTPLLKDGGVALCACVYHLDPWSVKTLIRFLSFILPPTCFCSDYTAQVCFHVFRFSFLSGQLEVLASHY